MGVTIGPSRREGKPKHGSLTQLLREVRSGRRVVPRFVGHCIRKEEAIQRKSSINLQRSPFESLGTKQTNQKTGIGIQKSRVEIHLK